jgi:2'-5' RNA ligase
MELQAKYDQLWQAAAAHLAKGCCETDALLDDPADSRRGITLIARPPGAVKAAIQDLLEPLRNLEPDQYYYPAPDLHLTILSLISCHPGFTLNQVAPQAYIQVVREALQDVAAFEIEFKGVTASPSCVMVQGFVADTELSKVRQNLRSAFQDGGLFHTIDSRYPLQTAHSTVVRYRKPLRQPQSFLEKLQTLRTKDLGTWRVQELELVFNDWYQRQALTQTLATFRLPLG